MKICITRKLRRKQLLEGIFQTKPEEPSVGCHQGGIVSVVQKLIPFYQISLPECTLLYEKLVCVGI